MQITGDNVLIAKETARVLGMGTYIRTPEGLPEMAPDGKVPKNLGKHFAMSIASADGFAQVPSPCCYRVSFPPPSTVGRRVGEWLSAHQTSQARSRLAAVVFTYKLCCVADFPARCPDICWKVD